MDDIHLQNKETIDRLRMALYNLDPETLPEQLGKLFDPECSIHLTYPFDDLCGPGELYDLAYRPLIKAIPDLERRDFIVMAGPSTDSNWVGCAGHYVGVFERPWLDIPPTFHPVAMRFHEFYRLEEGLIIEMQALWDIPELMMQARAWPMAPALGVEWMVPSPAPQDGLSLPPRREAESDVSQKLVMDMIAGLQKHSEGGASAMHLEDYWHPKMTWYGPAGIGTNRRISGFRNWHQIPFLKAMPDRVAYAGGHNYWFADGSYVAETGWPNMTMSLSGDGWLGIAPVGKKITMRSLDFWRCENSVIRENWVLIDLLHIYKQIGVDVITRMREFTVDRQERRPGI